MFRFIKNMGDMSKMIKPRSHSMMRRSFFNRLISVMCKLQRLYYLKFPGLTRYKLQHNPFQDLLCHYYGPAKTLQILYMHPVIRLVKYKGHDLLHEQIHEPNRCNHLGAAHIYLSVTTIYVYHLHIGNIFMSTHRFCSGKYKLRSEVSSVKSYGAYSLTNCTAFFRLVTAYWFFCLFALSWICLC